jgi:glycosidase
MNTAPEWGQELVIVAKLLPVWLHQLSIKYGLQISTLDQIPEEELKELSELCITGLWLVGVWQRSPASRKIKKALGNPFALASAYSIFDYEIDPALGGTAAMKVLKDKASHHGIHLGADVIPNHTAIDSQWLKHHPDWFITTDTPPFPSYTFTSPNLSEDETLDVRLEDHYYDHRDAAVVFRYQNRQIGSNPLFVYHGNDGTHIPWNDTAQLNYLNPEVRKKMIDTIVAVSGDFPLIRLDAAMTLTRLHYKRLWFPPAGEGGAIPSRSGHMDSHQEFDARYGPLEFWQEVLIALNRANPQALLMAEAFWLMEPYFINQIGMHKVYHSAFMNLLRDHYGQPFNAYLHHLLGHYPLSTLNHFVNFLSTPDEAPAAVAFGKGDRYWAASILLTTFPGTPLYAHNQWDGIEEQYGMEFAAPMNNLPKDQGFYDHHRACLLPILRYRKLFSSAEGFRLCGFSGQGAEEDAHVIAFSNTTDKMTAFVIVNYQDKPISGKLLPAELEAPTSGSIEFLAESHQSEVTGTPFVGLTLKAWGYCVFLVRRE